jgi:hypothetical protein
MFATLFLPLANISKLYDSNYKYSYSKALVDRFCVRYHECQWEFIINHDGKSTTIGKQAASDIGGR